jgi:hypothetical protein
MNWFMVRNAISEYMQIAQRFINVATHTFSQDSGKCLT